MRRALYQLQLVRACDARRFIPADLRLVELFGCAPTPASAAPAPPAERAAAASLGPRRYTLGGVFLARYSDSPVGAFDEVRAPGRAGAGGRGRRSD